MTNGEKFKQAFPCLDIVDVGDFYNVCDCANDDGYIHILPISKIWWNREYKESKEKKGEE